MSTKPSLFARVTAGVKGFVSHAIGYVPRGAALTAGLFGADAVLQSTTGFSILGVSSLTNAELLPKFLTHLAVGTGLSGLIGGGLEAVNAGRPAGQEVQAPAIAGIIKPSEGELNVADRIIGETQEAAQAFNPTSGLPAALLKQTLQR